MSQYNLARDKGSDSPNGDTPDQAETDNALADRVEELEQRLDALEGIFSNRVVEKENAHVCAQDQDAREKLTVGGTKTVVVEEPPAANNGKAVTHVDGVVTFIQQSSDANKGDTLKVKFTDVQPNYAHAIALD